MGAPLSPRLDAESKLAPNLVANADNQVAKAEGLTESEAAELVVWLKEKGYELVELIQEPNCCSVLWKR